jgi:hypothetical protein
MTIHHGLLRTLLLLAFSLPAFGSTWFIRADGGTRYSDKTHIGQCDGRTDAKYPGKGVNQHCAFSDYRYLYDDRQSYGVSAWVISGGDTVIIDNTKPWRVGFDQGKTANDVWCFGQQGPYSCSNPTIPSGTAAQHTRILGRNYRECSASASKSQLFGGFGVGVVLNLSGAQYVDVQCLEITRHSQCIVHGNPVYPRGCQTGYPLDDYDSEGITTDTKTHDLLLQDLWIHGQTDRGIVGPIGGVVTANRVDIAYNGEAGWDFDDGRSTPSINGVWKLTHSVIEWNGCNQEYPQTHVLPAVSCYSQSSGGYGDGVGTPAGMGLDVYIDHSIFRYNTQDGLDLGHVDTGTHTLSIKNSLAYGNNGGQFKWGPNFTSALFEGNVAIANCMRLSVPVSGAPTTYNVHLGDFCRANDAISFNFRQSGTLTITDNTIVTYAPTTFDIGCWDNSCSNSTLIFKNNIIRGYDNPGTYNIGGKQGGPGGFYYQKPIGHIIKANNDYYGLRDLHCLPSISGDRCVDPQFSREPTQFSRESDLDHFDYRLSETSPVKHSGVTPEEIPAY